MEGYVPCHIDSYATTSGFCFLEDMDSQPDPIPDIEAAGCVHCMQEHLVDDFNILEPGDQISLPGRIPIIGRCYRHHAIVQQVSNISDGGKTATVTVVDVDEKGKVKLLCCPCFRQPYPVREHYLRDKQNHSLAPYCCDSKTCCKTGCCGKECECECTMCDDVALCCCLGPRLKLKRVKHRQRKFSKESTLTRASKWKEQFAKLSKDKSCGENCSDCCEDCCKDCNVCRCLNNCGICCQIFCEPDEENHTFSQTDNKMSTLKYCFCLQNCEHFANSCVNGPDEVTQKSLKESVSLQSLQFVKFIIWFIFWALQVTFYGFNFWVYAVFAKEDPDYEFLSNDLPLKEWLNETCTKRGKTRRFFETTCDWKVLGIFLGIFFFISTLNIFLYYLPLFIKRHICHNCFVKEIINRFISRNIAFILTEFVNIVMEKPIYWFVNLFNVDRTLTICLLIGVSILGACIFYILVNMVDRIIVSCFSSYGTCSFSMNYYKYVPFRYCTWLCHRAICNCYRAICKK